MTIFYQDQNGIIFDSSEVRHAFRTLTGRKDLEFDRHKDKDVNTAEYVQFVDKLLTGRKAFVIKPTVELLLSVGKPTSAFRLYMDENKCSAKEAREAIKQRMKERRNENV